MILYNTLPDGDIFISYNTIPYQMETYSYHIIQYITRWRRIDMM